MRALLFTLLLSGLVANAETKPKTVPIALQDAYAPVGFDSNDRSQIVVEGIFPNTCYRVGPYKAEIVANTKEIRIHQTAYRYEGICLQIQVPFSHMVELGLVRAENYKIVDGSSNKEIGKFTVKEATTPEQDDELYAPVTDANLNYEKGGAAPILMLEGSFTNSCLSIFKVDIDYQDRVVVVKPVARKSKSTDCKSGRFPFRYAKALKSGLKNAYLLHIRSMNGNAINKMVAYLE